jgi:hypothetical protein
VILTLANKFAYHAASWMNLTHVKQVLFVDFIWLVANFFTFVMRFLIFHYVLFTEPTTAARAAATGPDTVPPGHHRGEATPDAAPASAAPAATAEVTPGTQAKTVAGPDGTTAAPAKKPAPGKAAPGKKEGAARTPGKVE